jgi:hypothetical protein
VAKESGEKVAKRVAKEVALLQWLTSLRR